jgi:drug/metabolite transporter (DMT)-like permease
MPASGASLLLNAEGVFTAVLAWVAFRENFDRRIALGMVLIAAGAVVLSWPESVSWAGLWPALAILGACFAWGLDNNLTRKVALNDATWIASIKGLVAGSVNLLLAWAVGDALPGGLTVAAAMVVGFLAYGVSLALFVVGLRHLGAARTGAYFSVAPFFGAALALLGGEPVTLTFLVAGALMAAGVWLHLTEQHSHLHAHEAMLHDHEHEHDEHHQHTHADGQFTAGKHTHPHRHEPLSHAHAHYPDAHHRHLH